MFTTEIFCYLLSCYWKTYTNKEKQTQQYHNRKYTLKKKTVLALLKIFLIICTCFEVNIFLMQCVHFLYVIMENLLFIQLKIYIYSLLTIKFTDFAKKKNNLVNRNSNNNEYAVVELMI